MFILSQLECNMDCLHQATSLICIKQVKSPVLDLTDNYWQILEGIGTGLLEQWIPEMQNSTEIVTFSNCECLQPFLHKSEFGNILTLKTRNFFFAGVEYIPEAFRN